jgi:CRISPR system Cascade subunit CasE
MDELMPAPRGGASAVPPPSRPSPEPGATSREGATSAHAPASLWLSRIVIGRPQRVRDVYSLHQALWRAFTRVEAGRCFLFRADVIAAERDRPPRLVVLVQSEHEPNWSALGDLVTEARHKPLRRHAAGDALRFFVRANPTACRKGRHELPSAGPEEFRARRGKRVALWKPDDQLAWLRRKASAGGFGVVAVRTSQSRPWRWSRGETRARHDGVDFEGVLRIDDADAFERTVAAGIGPAKAFGFGLLSLAPRPVMGGAGDPP